MLQSLSDPISNMEPTQGSLMEGLMPLTRLQRLHLTKCVPHYHPLLKCHGPSHLPRTTLQPVLCTRRNACFALP